MAADLGPGDWVEVINPDNLVVCPGGAYRPGELCIVEEVGTDRAGPSLNCVGKARPWEMGYTGWGWSVRNFRPIYRPRADFIESLKAPPISAPVRETEDA